VTTYLTGATNADVEEHAGRANLGLLATPDTYREPVVDRWRQAGAPFALDNGAYGAFKQGRPFDFDKWRRWIDGMGRDAWWAVVPDVVGELTPTLDRFDQYVDEVTGMGFVPALAAQDGMTPDQLDDRAGALFVGGTDDWKLTPASATLMAAAKDRGMLVHVARVNSWKRYKWAAERGADSVDGTYLRFGFRANLPKLLGWLDRWQAEHPQGVLDFAAAA